MQQLTWKTSPFGEAYIAEIGGSLFEQHPVRDIFDRYLHHDFKTTHNLLVVVGSDSGLLLPYLDKLAVKTQSVYVCFDNSKVVESVIEMGWRDSEHVKLVEQSYDISGLSFDPQFSEFFLRHAIKVLPSIAVSMQKADYKTMWDRISSDIRIQTIAMNSNQSVEFINRHLDNMTDLVFPIRLLRGKLQNKVAVLLGGGPSVEQVFEWVRLHRDQVVVFAANRLSSRLKVEAISPDFFVAVDPQPQLLDYCKEMFDFADDSVLLTTASVASNVLNQWSGKMAYGEPATPFYPLLTHERQQPNFRGAGPTVMNFAVQAACFMGVSHIVLAGMDLCHTLSGQSHESSSLEAASGQVFHNAESKVQTFSGFYASTTPQMALARNILQEQVDVWKHKTQFWQINPDAARISDVGLLALDNLPFALSATEEQMHSVHTLLTWHSDYALQHLNSLKNSVDYRLNLYKKLIKRIIPVLRDVKRLTRLSPQALSRATKQVVRVKNDFENSLGPERYVLFEHAYLDYVKISEPLAQSAKEQTLLDIQAVLTSFFSAAYQSLDRFVKRLLSINGQIELRQHEALGQLTDEMLKAWLERNEPGRAAVWCARHGTQTLTEHQKELLNQAKASFKLLLSHQVPSFAKHIADPKQQFENLWQQLVLAQQRSDILLIEQLIERFKLLNYPESDQVAIYAELLLASLRKDWQRARESASQIELQHLKIPMHKILVQVFLATESWLDLLSSLEVLCQTDVKYFAIYADVASKLGLFELAEFAYQMAVHTHPGDALTFNEVYQWAHQHQRTVLLAWLVDWASAQENKSK